MEWRRRSLTISVDEGNQTLNKSWIQSISCGSKSESTENPAGLMNPIIPHGVIVADVRGIERL